MPIGAVVGAVGSVAGGLLSSSAAGKAADAQSAAADKQIALAREQYNTTRNDLAQFRDAGGLGTQAYLYELGLGNAPTFGGNPADITTIKDTAPAPVGIFGSIDQAFANWGKKDKSNTTTRYSVNGQLFDSLKAAQDYAAANPTGGSTYGGYQETPGTQYLLQKGADSVNALAGSRGGLDSGATRQALQENAMGIANQGYNTYLNRLAGLSDMGANAASMNATNSANYVANASNALANMGNAQSAGYIGSANAINQGIGNAISSYGYLSNLNKPQSSYYSSGTAGQGIW
ncbi:hypothetical protein [Thioclava sp. DLFJ4-1]|uniref:hypothetical protein n=1 Tax=Thioclava sp. DLFJ4-1 TaxID=1915313 RepID=UPI0011805ED1|nr:hypothetical protein [Thioclava sp. DLFJ4-1]